MVDASGGHGAFPLLCGINQIPHEIDTWNENGVSLVWVKVPLLTSDTEIGAHYGSDAPGTALDRSK